MARDAAFWIDHLQMNEHPEGGFYKEMYRSEEIVEEKSLPLRYKGNRNFGTSIYFLLEGQHFSAFHRIKSDEIWHYYEGNALVIYLLGREGLKTQPMGINPEHGELRQLVIPHGMWFAAEVANRRGFSLVGCTVAPGFDFDDFELAGKKQLVAEFPGHQELIERLCVK